MTTQRYAMAVRLKNDKRKYYIENHANVWPEVLSELKKIKISFVIFQSYGHCVSFYSHRYSLNLILIKMQVNTRNISFSFYIYV